MSADHDINLIAAYVEGRLDAVERARTAVHLASCLECRTILAELIRSSAAPALAESRNPRRWTVTRVWLPLAAMLLISVAAGLMVFRTPGQAPAPVVESPTQVIPAPSPGPPATAVEPAPAPAPVPGPATNQPATRAAGERTLGTKRFRLVAGEWVDSTYDSFALLDVVSVTSEDERRRIVASVPELEPYLVLGRRFTVVVNQKVYRFELAGG